MLSCWFSLSLLFNGSPLFKVSSFVTAALLVSAAPFFIVAPLFIAVSLLMVVPFLMLSEAWLGESVVGRAVSGVWSKPLMAEIGVWFIHCCIVLGRAAWC